MHGSMENDLTRKYFGLWQMKISTSNRTNSHFYKEEDKKEREVISSFGIACRCHHCRHHRLPLSAAKT